MVWAKSDNLLQWLHLLQAWGQFSEVARHLACPFIPSPLSYHNFLFVISVSKVPFKSRIKLLTCSNGEQWCPLAASAGSICTLLYRGNLIIFKWELLLKSGNVT